EQAASRRKLAVDEVGDDLGIRIGRELIAPAKQVPAHLVVILDDAVVHNRDAARNMRMRVLLGRHAMRSPARVRDSDVTAQSPFSGELGEPGDAPLAAQPLQGAVDYRDTGRVIAAILEPAQSLEQDRNYIALRYRTNDSTHRSLSGSRALRRSVGVLGPQNY